MSLGAEPFSIPLGAKQALVHFPGTPVPFSCSTQASSHNSRSLFHMAQTMAASSNCHYFELQEKSQPMQNPHRQTACSYGSQNSSAKPMRSVRIQSFHGSSKRKWGRQGNHEIPPPYAGQHRSLHSVSKRKVGMKFARTRQEDWPVRNI